MNKNKGFTLIELLVVIAIIGILSSVVLASLNSARAKGADAAIKSNLNNIRAQAELYYDNHSNSYTGVCASTDVDGINKGFLAAAQQNDVVFNNCNDSLTAWAAAVKLKTGSSTAWCVDSTGNSKIIGPVNDATAFSETDCN